MARIPDKKEHQNRLMELELKDRRAIARAVNRGNAVEKKAHAPLAVGVARRQQRFWKVAWLLGPLIGIIQMLVVDVGSGLINAVVGTFALGAMSAYWLWRARQAEERNLELAGGRRPPPQARAHDSSPTEPMRRWWARFRGADGSGSSDAAAAASRGHLPGEDRGTTAAGAERDATGQGGSPPGSAPRPPAPRGRKRRR